MPRQADDNNGSIKMQSFKTYKTEYNENSIKKGVEEYGLTKKDVELIKKFMDSRRGSGKAAGTTRSLYSRIVNIRKVMPVQFSDATIQDLHDYCEKINSGYEEKVTRKDKKTGKLVTTTEINRLEASTQNTAKEAVKLFYKYLIKNNHSKITREELEEIKKAKVTPKLESGDLLTIDDINAMIATTRDPMLRALIAVHAEAGCRISESAPAKWNQFVFDEKGCVFNVIDYKTNKRRSVRLITAVPHLAQWKQIHPAYSPTGPVFINSRNATLNYEFTRDNIRRAARKAGIDKKVKTHLFRHSRVTQMLRDGVKMDVVQKMVWGKASKMVENYNHLCSEDIDNEVMRVYGDDEKKPVVEVKKPVLIQCPNCSAINPETSKFCNVCGNNIREGAKKAGEAQRSEREREMADKLQNLEKAFMELVRQTGYKIDVESIPPAEKSSG